MDTHKVGNLNWEMIASNFPEMLAVVVKWCAVLSLSLFATYDDDDGVDGNEHCSV